MFLRNLGAICALCLIYAATAQAADPQMTVLDDGTSATQQRIVVAAHHVCSKAVATDPLEYGSYEECVAFSIAHAHAVTTGPQAVADAK